MKKYKILQISPAPGGLYCKFGEKETKVHSRCIGMALVEDENGERSVEPLIADEVGITLACNDDEYGGMSFVMSGDYFSDE